MADMKIIQIKPINGFMEVPADMGIGYVRGYILDPKFRIIIRHFKLKENWMLDRKIDEKEHFVRISLHNVLPFKDMIKENEGHRSANRHLLPAVVIATKGLNFERFYGGEYVNSIVITVEKQRLSELLRAKMGSPILQMILTGDQPLLFEEFVSPELLRLSAELDAGDPPKHLEEFYFKIKAEELIYQFFVCLLQRQVRPYQALNATDINAVYRVKEKILSDLHKPPVLADLVQLSSMSLSKLNRIFKQVFGSSIFTYYQSFRMKEAAFLIKEKNMSVSEAGYTMGFTNLSHFSRLFETHMGMKPKKYAMTASAQH